MIRCLTLRVQRQFWQVCIDVLGSSNQILAPHGDLHHVWALKEIGPLKHEVLLTTDCTQCRQTHAHLGTGGLAHDPASLGRR